MSSTAGVQNLLVNVFRPVYLYDATATLFATKLDMSNMNTYYGNNVTVLWANIGDSNSNVYVGKLAGNDPTVSLKNCSNVTAVGYAAGSNISNVQNATYVGAAAGANSATAREIISVGVATLGGGVSNIYIGNRTGSIGSNNIFIGHDIAPGNVNWQFRLSKTGTVVADMSLNWVGIGGRTAPSDVGVKMDISGDTRIDGNVGIFLEPGDRTLDVNGNFRARDASANALDFSNGITTSTGGYASIRGSVEMSNGGWDSIIGPIKKGIILVSALDPDNSSNRASAMYFAYDNDFVYAMSIYSNSSQFQTNTSNSNLKLDWNGTSNITPNYSITYFPLP